MPYGPAKPCIVVGCPHVGHWPTRQSRCPEHQAAYTKQRDQYRGKTAERGYGNQWRRHSERLTKEVGACQFCGHIGSPDNPLTTNHDRPVSKGGTIEEANTVLCRQCNSRLGNR